MADTEQTDKVDAKTAVERCAAMCAEHQGESPFAAKLMVQMERYAASLKSERRGDVNGTSTRDILIADLIATKQPKASDTPRTDAVDRAGDIAEMVALARQLERELTDVQDDVLRLHGEKMKFFEAKIDLERQLAVASATASPVTSTTAPYSNNVTTGDRLVCAHCGGEHFQAMKYFDYELSESDYPTEHPDRCRKLDGKFYDPPIIEDGQSRPHWRCHKKAGHSAGNGGKHCSTHRDCGARSADRHICGHEPDHDGPHAWEPSVAPEEERKKP